MNIKSLTIYCSSSDNLEEMYYLKSIEISKIIANYKLSIVYGGGKVGIMGEIAKTFMKLKVDVTGIIPDFLATKELMFNEINHLKIVKDMSERKKLLFEMGDAFLVLPGGTGTLEEISEVLSWKVLGIHNKPIVFLNINNFWNPFFEQLIAISKNNFGDKNLQTFFEVIETPNQINEILKKWKK